MSNTLLRTGSKGVTGMMEVLLTIMLGACVLLVVTMIPRIMQDMLTLLSKASAEATARDLSGIITISGAGEDTTIITYQGEQEEVKYDVTVKDRLVKVGLIPPSSFGVGGWGGGGAAVPGDTTNKMLYGESKAAVDPNGDFQGVNIFTVTKQRSPTCTSTAVCDAYQLTAS